MTEKRHIVRLLTLCAALSLTACSMNMFGAVRQTPGNGMEGTTSTESTASPVKTLGKAGLPTPKPEAVPVAAVRPAPSPPPVKKGKATPPAAVAQIPPPAPEINTGKERKQNSAAHVDFTYRNATLDEDTAWHGEVSVIGWVTVAPQATLTVEAGTTVRFEPETPAGPGGSGLLVQGRLVAIGNGEQPILFTSRYVTPAAGDWQGIVLLASDKKNVMEECRVEGATIGLETLYAQVGLRDMTASACGTGLRFRDSFVNMAGGGASGCTVGLGLLNSEAEVRDASINGNRQGVTVRGGSLYLANTTLYGNEQAALDADNLKLKITSSSFTVNGIGLKLSGCEGSVSYSRVLSNREAGMNLTGSRLRVNGNEITQNSGVGLRITEGENVVWGNLLSANNGHDLEYQGHADLPAMGNWWGGVAPALLSDRIRVSGDGGGRVLYIPILSERPQFGL